MATEVGKGENSLLSDPGSELRLWREREKKGENVICAMEKRHATKSVRTRYQVHCT